MGHGVIGGIGGAIAGSKLQDYAKDKKKEKKAEEKRRKEEEKMRKKMANKQSGRRDSSSSSSSSSDSSDDEKKKRKKYGAAGLAAGVGVAGAGAYIAHNQHQQHQQQQQQQQQQGVQMRGGFSSSARDIQLDRDFDLIASLTDRHGKHKLSSMHLNKYLSNEWGRFRWVPDGGNFGASARAVRLVDGGRVLEAELGDGQGGWNKDYVRLDERIGNDDGDLVFVA